MTMTIYVLPFEKMHGLGNDFILLERRHLPNNVNDFKLAKLLCDRNFAIGADGIIIVDFSPTKEADFKWDYYNSDGSIAEMCGNGMRCFAKYVFERGLTDNTSFSVLTKAGIIFPTIETDGTVTVNIGSPTLLSDNVNVKTLSFNNQKSFNYTYLEVGNPHCVIILDSEISDNDFKQYGPIIEKHPNFPKGVNVEFVVVKNKNRIISRVWERGAGPTLACGTGACASLVATNIRGLTEDSVTVQLPGGDLKTFWDKDKNTVYLNGPVSFVFTGQFNLNPKDVLS
ncbi:MAG: diaminopimelate epimerase [Candidatus Melainabacteria bacterium RIFCSPHIGHO2_02_FULL_34_12]|nr:MAG: diaminopimelate epimerase [Candidatus Melainabacteria bacterium RIFCSPHIGHO2_02_FULL_34_12]